MTVTIPEGAERSSPSCPDIRLLGLESGLSLRLTAAGAEPGAWPHPGTRVQGASSVMSGKWEVNYWAMS